MTLGAKNGARFDGGVLQLESYPAVPGVGTAVQALVIDGGVKGDLASICLPPGFRLNEAVIYTLS